MSIGKKRDNRSVCNGLWRKRKKNDSRCFNSLKDSHLLSALRKIIVESIRGYHLLFTFVSKVFFYKYIYTYMYTHTDVEYTLTISIWRVICAFRYAVCATDRQLEYGRTFREGGRKELEVETWQNTTKKGYFFKGIINYFLWFLTVYGWQKPYLARAKFFNRTSATVGIVFRFFVCVCIPITCVVRTQLV